MQFNNLETQVKERQQNYELYAEKRDQSQISDAMDDRGLMNVVVAEQPTLSYVPARPKPMLERGAGHGHRAISRLVHGLSRRGGKKYGGHAARTGSRFAISGAGHFVVIVRHNWARWWRERK